MPFLLLFAFVPAILVIALAVMLISGVITFLTNRDRLTVENVSRIGTIEAFNKLTKKIDELKKTCEARKPKTVETIEIIVLKEK